MMAIIQNPVLILGAGINGAAIARELLLNGIPVCLVDVADISRGATAYSSRLIHGGLRYLEYADFALVRESLTERDRLLRLAPQFVKPLRFFIPVQHRTSGLIASALRFLHLPLASRMRSVPRGLWPVRMGLWCYDLLARKSPLPPHSVHSLTEAAMPAINRQRFRWVCAYYDGQMRYPERFVISLLRDSRNLAVENHVPFRVLTYHQAMMSQEGVDLYPLTEHETGEIRRSTQPTVSLQPSLIINATGAWLDRTLERMHVSSKQLIGGTKGSHLLMRHDQLRAALKGQAVYAEATDGRPVFLLPFDPFVLVGTTDLPFEDDPARAVADPSEVDYLLSSVQQVFPHVKVSQEDVFWHSSGVRPLPYSKSPNPASVTRRHILEENDSLPIPMLSIIGGKLTTCRQLAEETVAVVARKLGSKVGRDSRSRCLPGAEAYPVDDHALRLQQQGIADRQQMNLGQVQAVWSLCGTLTEMMLSRLDHGIAVERERDSVVGTRLPRRFVQRVIQDEWCMTLMDLVERRLMLLFEPNLSLATLRELAQLMVDQRELAAEQMEAAVHQCQKRLQSHFGMRV